MLLYALPSVGAFSVMHVFVPPHPGPVAASELLGADVGARTLVHNADLPLGMLTSLIGGPFFPLAILFYWLANNSWTFGQLTVAHRLQDKRKATVYFLNLGMTSMNAPLDVRVIDQMGLAYPLAAHTERLEGIAQFGSCRRRRRVIAVVVVHTFTSSPHVPGRVSGPGT